MPSAGRGFHRSPAALCVGQGARNAVKVRAAYKPPLAFTSSWASRAFSAWVQGRASSRGCLPIAGLCLALCLWAAFPPSRAPGKVHRARLIPQISLLVKFLARPQGCYLSQPEPNPQALTFPIHLPLRLLLFLTMPRGMDFPALHSQ